MRCKRTWLTFRVKSLLVFITFTLLFLKNYQLIFEFFLYFCSFVVLSFILIKNRPHSCQKGNFKRLNCFCSEMMLSITLTSIIFKIYFNILGFLSFANFCCELIFLHLCLIVDDFHCFLKAFLFNLFSIHTYCFL